ncbi:hypothetical protein SAMN05661091_4492 [Paenibacillus uliginis N3/975]|uniref:MarR family transcriptional regulator n=1 Tax=Paenibacillus uliginis N3/975 TaxID=1313296 RepID=A0A1X7HMV2_9BACL|nr:hypothetical protein [Paenibacillus uliginis]SMF89027.1 hypothetical protein SAMN05661091_4492 [Paenibacillus uliginis N3/975]
MLPDLERKLLRILVNYPAHRRIMPTMKLIEQMTGRSVQDITQGLKTLEGKGYLLWQDENTTQSIVVMKDSEDVPQLPRDKGSNIDYWTFY